MSSNKRYKIDTKKPVLVTGGTGYVASVLIKQLLDEGVTVHATVRDPSKTERFQYLQDLADSSKGSIKFFKGDLVEDGSFEDAMKGCEIVFHTASPFTLDPKADPVKDIVEPAVNGTRNVLNQCTKTPSVKRVVLTSSVGAVHCDISEIYETPNKVFDESCWNKGSSLTYQPYFLSKTLAEQEAWIISGSQTQWTMAVINPSLVLGPGVKYHKGSESYSIIEAMGRGDFASGTAEFNVGVVDVRDVARAHIVAGYDWTVTGRNIVCGSDTGFLEMASTLLKRYPEYPLPTRKIPKLLIYLLAPYIPGTDIKRKYVWNNVGIDLKYDTSKSKRDLGLEYRSLDSTLNDMFQQIIDEGVIGQEKAPSKN